MKKFLNLGCGKNYLTHWTNIDFYSDNKAVIQHDLSKGLPFPNQTFDFVYHSHVLEHFTLEMATFLLNECFRVLKPGGFIRVVVPDLEMIIANYISLLEQIKKGRGNELLFQNLQWIKLELLDQASRNYKGGEMVKFLTNPKLGNKDFVIGRLGEESKVIFDDQPFSTKNKNSLDLIKLFIKAFKIRGLIKKMVLTKAEKQNLAIGEFRTSGEIHQWMYEEVSLKRLLHETGFNNVIKTTAYSSYLPDWEDNNLDIINGNIRKPDSLFVEAQKTDQ